MTKMKFIFITLLSILLSIGIISCGQSNIDSRIANLRIAEEFVKTEATFHFDGIPETLELKSTTSAGSGWEFTFGFDSRHAGYGDRSGQVLAQIITSHSAKVTVQDGKVTAAIMDGRWNMINQRFDVEIKLAPIDDVKIYLMKSNPPQIGVHIVGGLPDGCTTFHDIETTREGNTINVKVTVQRPLGMNCTAIYTTFEQDVNLGTDFVFGTTYTLNVNDYSTTFNGTLMKGEGFAIYLTRDNIPPGNMEILSHVDVAEWPIISIQDIVTYNAQTYEIQLTDEAFNRLAQLDVPVGGKSFLVCIDGTPIYGGAFWTPISSMSFDGITIWKPLGSQEPKVITLEQGYPSSSFYNGEDPRNNPAILQSLEQSGKLITGLSIEDIKKLPSSFKGYELYSWQEESQWHFTLITGTNRTKTIDEITSSDDYISAAGWIKIHVVGVEAIKEVLSKLPGNEFISWCDGLHLGQASDADLQFPPLQILNSINDFARQCGLNFVIP
jgi:hypothetical protein